MYVTEKEAGKKVCCMSISGFARCRGSDCMAWRFDLQSLATTAKRKIIMVNNDTAMYANTEEATGGRPANVPESWEFCPADEDPAAWIEPQEDANARRRGYCAMAGKPESL